MKFQSNLLPVICIKTLKNAIQPTQIEWFDNWLRLAPRGKSLLQEKPNSQIRHKTNVLNMDGTGYCYH